MFVCPRPASYCCRFKREGEFRARGHIGGIGGKGLAPSTTGREKTVAVGEGKNGGGG